MNKLWLLVAGVGLIVLFSFEIGRYFNLPTVGVSHKSGQPVWCEMDLDDGAGEQRIEVSNPACKQAIQQGHYEKVWLP